MIFRASRLCPVWPRRRQTSYKPESQTWSNRHRQPRNRCNGVHSAIHVYVKRFFLLHQGCFTDTISSSQPNETRNLPCLHWPSTAHGLIAEDPDSSTTMCVCRAGRCHVPFNSSAAWSSVITAAKVSSIASPLSRKAKAKIVAKQEGDYCKQMGSPVPHSATCAGLKSCRNGPALSIISDLQ